MTSLPDLLRTALRRDLTGTRFVSRLLERLPEAHWGATRQPGRMRSMPDGPWARDVTLPETFADWAASRPDELRGALSAADRVVHLPCVLETDSFVLAFEDARVVPLETGTSAYAARHRLSRVIEAVRVLGEGRLYGVGVVAPPDFSEPRRAAVLEGLPHIEREEAEDLYASYWGWCTEAQLREALDGDL